MVVRTLETGLTVASEAVQRSCPKRKVVGSKPGLVVLRESSPESATTIEHLVEKSRALLRTEGPLEERLIVEGIGFSPDQVSRLVPTTLGEFLVEKCKGFCCVEEGNLKFYYMSERDGEGCTCEETNKSFNVCASCASTPSPTVPTTTSARIMAAAVTDIPYHLDIESEPYSKSAYESAEDKEAWTVSRSVTPLSVGSRMTAPLVTCNRGAQTQHPGRRSVGVMTAPTGCTSVDVQTDHLDEAAVLKGILKKCDTQISELQEALLIQSSEHREEIQQLHNKISKLQAQLQKLTEGKLASAPLASVKSEVSSKEPEIYNLSIEPKKVECDPVASKENYIDKKELLNYYELKRKLELSGGRGETSDQESVWSSRAGSPTRSKKAQQQEGLIIRRVKREKPNFTDVQIREYLNQFRRCQHGLTGMTVNTIVAGILALMKSDAQGTQRRNNSSRRAL